MLAAPLKRRPLLGKEIYESDIRPQVKANLEGEVVAIDVDRGSYALGENAMPRLGLRDRHRDAQVWLMRVGPAGPCCTDQAAWRTPSGILNREHRPRISG